jgi:hypothetical protein
LAAGADRGLKLAPWQVRDWPGTTVHRTGHHRLVREVIVLCRAAFGGFFEEPFTGPANIIINGWKKGGVLPDQKLALAIPVKYEMRWTPPSPPER